MQLKPISPNCNELILDNGKQVLFSYQTPVACWIDGQFYRTAKKWSVTTTKQINRWAHCAIEKPQGYFDNLIKG